MAAIDFPDSPNENDIVVRGGSSWQWTGSVWKKIYTLGPALPTGTNSLDLVAWQATTESWAADSQENIIGTYVANEVASKADASHTHVLADITDYSTSSAQAILASQIFG